MSNEALNRAWKINHPDLSAASKFVLVALADFADEAMSCFPGQERLAAMTGQSIRSVARHLEVLEGLGMLRRERRMVGNKRTSDRYFLTLSEPAKLAPANMSDAGSEPDKTISEPDNHDIRNLTTVAEEPSEEPPVKNLKRARKAAATKMPENWVPKSDLADYARELGLNPGLELASFKAWTAARGQEYVLWDAGFRNHLINAAKRTTFGGSAASSGSTTDRRVAEAQTLKDKYLAEEATQTLLEIEQ